jgi:subtilisin family serine protease
MDRGIDWRHPDFVNDDGTTRIKWILDMTGQNWCASTNPEPVEYAEEQINAALRGEGELAHRDAVGHGTATAGLAAGNGASLDDRRYAGVAPEADLVIVKMTSEGAPAHDGLPAEAAFNGCVDDALAWVDEKIELLGQPAVATWNAGTQWGPIDGTSAASRAIDAVFGPDRPGRVFVAPSGDEGSLQSHSGGDYGPGAPLEIQFNHSDSGTGYLTAWYSGNAPANISVRLSNGTTVGPVGPGALVEENGVTLIQYAPGNEFYPWESTSGDRAVWIRIVGHAGRGALIVESQGGSGHIDAYGDVLGQAYLTPSILLLDHQVSGRLNDTSATIGAVVVGVHVERHEYIDETGRRVNLATSDGTTGDIWPKSSPDPTRDGRAVMDVTAAGQNAFAALGQESYWSTLSSAIPRDGEGWYVRFGGTSGSGPIVVGTVALMLEANPDLTANQVKEILRATAVSDEFTGATPNATWGYGKVDILAAVEAAGALASP